MKNSLTSEQVAALKAFAAEYGRNWKSELRQCWMSGIYPSGCNSASLQLIRNGFGPSWLVRFKLKDVA